MSTKCRHCGQTMDPTFERDVQECDIPPDVLAELLKDRTTGDNVLWMTDDYRNSGAIAVNLLQTRQPEIWYHTGNLSGCQARAVRVG